MLSAIIIILGVSFILYTLLGGADFGAGIIETFAGKKGEKTVSKAIAPVWEANHVWLILAIVIIFTGFPYVYSALSTVLHIPLMIVLIGIILRGTSFTFRHYDVAHGITHKYYTTFFKISSFVTPFFLGITLGAMIFGDADPDAPGSFYEKFIHPWFNWFCVMMGLFTTSLFGYIAAVFMIGEASYTIEQKRYIRLARIFTFVTGLAGILVFVVAEAYQHDLFHEFFHSPISIISLSLVLLLVPLVFYLFPHPNIIYLRAVTAIQVSLIIFGWFAIQFPILVYEKDGRHLTFYNTQAPSATLYQLLIALIVGLLLVTPSFYFLYHVFKKAGDHNSN